MSKSALGCGSRSRGSACATARARTGCRQRRQRCSGTDGVHGDAQRYKEQRSAARGAEMLQVDPCSSRYTGCGSSNSATAASAAAAAARVHTVRDARSEIVALAEELRVCGASGSVVEAVAIGCTRAANPAARAAVPGVRGERGAVQRVRVRGGSGGASTAAGRGHGRAQQISTESAQAPAVVPVVVVGTVVAARGASGAARAQEQQQHHHQQQ